MKYDKYSYTMLKQHTHNIIINMVMVNINDKQLNFNPIDLCIKYNFKEDKTSFHSTCMLYEIKQWHKKITCLSFAKCKNFFRSDLEKPPMGLMSAELQSYLVMYPRRASSTLADPSTRRPPCLPRTHNINWKVIFSQIKVQIYPV